MPDHRRELDGPLCPRLTALRCVDARELSVAIRKSTAAAHLTDAAFARRFVIDQAREAGFVLDVIGLRKIGNQIEATEEQR